MLLVLLKPICADVQDEKLQSCVASEHQDVFLLSCWRSHGKLGIDSVLLDNGTTVVIALVLPAIFFGLPNGKKIV
jgi:hypothetical protein